MPLLTLTLRHLDRTAELEARVRESVQRLERVNDRIAHCHLTVDGSEAGAADGAKYAVKIDISVPGAQIHADNLHLDPAQQGDLNLALRAAFDDAKRQLQRLRWDH